MLLKMRLVKRTLSVAFVFASLILTNSCGKDNSKLGQSVEQASLPIPTITSNVSPSEEFVSTCNSGGGRIVISGGQSLCQKEVLSFPNLHFGNSGSVILLLGNNPWSGIPILSSDRPQGFYPFTTVISMEEHDKIVHSCTGSWSVDEDGEPEIGGGTETVMVSTGGAVLSLNSGALPENHLYIQQDGNLRFGFQNAPLTVNDSFDYSWNISCTKFQVFRCKNTNGITYQCP